MKEVKEVVHVPTRELAKEVLRVGDENGLCKNITDLDVFIKSFHKELCISFTDEICVAATHYYYEQEKYKILTAEEFLDRYKPKFKPIAMKCTKKQFKTIKPKLARCKVISLSRFKDCVYLVNNLAGRRYEISNVLERDNSDHNRQVFEEWNEKTFLEYCGIEVKDEINELDQLRKENEELRSINDTLNKENLEHHNELTLLKEKLKAIEDQPKVGDVCLFWDEGFDYKILSKLNENGGVEGVGKYDNCIKATNENIQAKINELNNEQQRSI